jgi:hypothetical protein
VFLFDQHGSNSDLVTLVNKMAIYGISANEFRKIDETCFSTEGLRERQGLQHLLRPQIKIVVPNTCAGSMTCS